jgi:hypothetical protein
MIMYKHTRPLFLALLLAIATAGSLYMDDPGPLIIAHRGRKRAAFYVRLLGMSWKQGARALSVPRTRFHVFELCLS